MSRMDEKRFLETSRGVLEYISIDLLNQVETRPVIWNRLHEDFKNREANDRAWDEIAGVFVPFYDDVDEDEKQSITEALKTRWKNCVQGLMSSVALKRKNDRLFRPFKYAREMEFYLETRGISLAYIYDAEEGDGVEKTKIKKESVAAEESMEEVTVENVVENEAVEPPRNKKTKTADTSMTFRSARLREKQTILEKNTTEKKATTPKNTKQIKQIKTTPISINGSASSDLDTSLNASIDEVKAVEESNEPEIEEVPHYNSTPQPKKQKISVAVNHPVIVTPHNGLPRTLTAESDESDQAFFDSIKPALRKMNETQKLDFQIDILQILKAFRTN